MPAYPRALPLPFPLVDPVGAVLSALGRALTGGVQSVAGWAFGRMTTALLATTRVHLDGWFEAPWRAMLTVAATLALPILLLGVVQEVLAGRPAEALRRGVLLPLLVGPLLVASRAGLGLCLLVVDGACALVVQLGIGGPEGFGRALERMRTLLGVADAPGVGVGAPGASVLVVVVLTAVLSFVIWVELAVRAALVYLLAAFIPVALAGLFWSVTTRWTRRLLELLAAVLLAQLVITVVLVLAAASLAGPVDGLAGGIDQTAVGLALLFLGSLGLPMTMRLVPHVAEAAVAAGSGAAVTARIGRHGGQLVGAIPHPVARLASAGPSGLAGAVGSPALRSGDAPPAASAGPGPTRPRSAGPVSS